MPSRLSRRNPPRKRTRGTEDDLLAVANEAVRQRPFKHNHSPGSLTLNRLAVCGGRRGRIYFLMPAGIQYGDHALIIKSDENILQIPFRIRTADEAAEFRSVWKEKLRQSKKGKGENDCQPSALENRQLAFD